MTPVLTVDVFYTYGCHEKALHDNAFLEHGPWAGAMFKCLSTLPVFTGCLHAREHGRLKITSINHGLQCI